VLAFRGGNLGLSCPCANKHFTKPPAHCSLASESRIQGYTSGVCVCVCVCVCVYVHIHRGQKKAQDQLKLELKALLSYPPCFFDVKLYILDFFLLFFFLFSFLQWYGRERTDVFSLPCLT
jgi:hypothetical protein